MENNIENEGKSVGERHIHTQELTRLLIKTEDGQMVTYEEMDAAIGIKTRPGYDGYQYQRSARIILERDAAIVFEVVNTIGLKRLSAEKVAMSTVAIYLARKRSTTARYDRRISTVIDDYDNLSPEAKIKTTVARTLLLFDRKLSKSKKILAIENKIKETEKLLEFDDTIKLFESV